MISYSRKTCLNFAFFKPVLLWCSCQYHIVTMGVGQAVVLQRSTVSAWERCPFATMASLVLHASPSQFQALQHTGYGGPAQLGCLLGAASAGQAHRALNIHVHIHIWAMSKLQHQESTLLQ